MGFKSIYFITFKLQVKVFMVLCDDHEIIDIQLQGF